MLFLSHTRIDSQNHKFGQMFLHYAMKKRDRHSHCSLIADGKKVLSVFIHTPQKGMLLWSWVFQCSHENGLVMKKDEQQLSLVHTTLC